MVAHRVSDGTPALQPAQPRQGRQNVAIDHGKHMNELPTLTIESDRQHGHYVCVPQSEFPELQDYLKDLRVNCLMNLRRMAHKRRPGTDLVLFLAADPQYVEDILTDYGFEIVRRNSA